jgi:DNA-binding NtrC family response regulator
MNIDRDKPRLMIVDDELPFSESLQLALEDAFEVSTAPSLRRARESLKAEVPDAILLDMRLPDGSGLDFLHELEALDSRPVVIIITAHATIDSAVTALKDGAVDYFTKPLDIDKLKRELNVYLENKFLHKKITMLDREIKKVIPPFVTSGTGKMKAIVDKVPAVAPLNIPVLIKGETGTGKEKLAEWIHALSGMPGELVVINCSAIPRDIFESELFGHTRGAFSGAVAAKQGLIERAEGGTLFLDEIGELPEDVQAKFLRVLEDGVYYRVGDSIEHRSRFRLISATNRELSEPPGRFRSDLFYRINGITFELPSLRERSEDIPLLVSTFLKEANNAYNKKVEGVSSKVMDHLMTYSWPGNIRELRWFIHRAAAVSSKRMIGLEETSSSPGMAPASPQGTEESVPFPEAMERLEREYIRNALAAAKNNKTRAAGMLGISVRVLHYKIKKYGL